MSACPRLVRSASKDTCVVVGNHWATDKVLVLEANAAYGFDGVGYRGLGSLRDVGFRPPGLVDPE
ncbi:MULTISPECIES: hypothetical protein [Corallococcus]|uniref:hypothetical protein n=1 Tax=Corallococcus TaxID=83461 RepID=UPI001F34F007|nr:MULTISPECIES: hypothetical protein [Corallococcus]